MKQCQRGFTLVELMVAMAIGTIIILGAGQLFLTTFRTFQTVDKISRKQEALIFAVNTLVDAGRKGGLGSYAIVADERSAGSDTRYYCVLQDLDENEPVVDLAQVDNAAGCPTLFDPNNAGASHTVTLLIGDCRSAAKSTCDTVDFIITDRNKIITS